MALKKFEIEADDYTEAHAIYVNPAHVVRLVEHSEGTYIILADGKNMGVKMGIDKIAEMLNSEPGL